MKKKIKEKILTLLKLHTAPEEIALGVALGVFIAIMPLYGLHTVLFLLTALLVRSANKIAILAGTSISNIFTLPFITWGGYAIGRAFLGENYPRLDWSAFKGFSYRNIANIYYPLFIGSIVLAVFLALIFYFVTLRFIRAKRGQK